MFFWVFTQIHSFFRSLFRRRFLYSKRGTAEKKPPTKRRPERIAQAVAVNCGYWTKAIALKRKPGALHFCSLIEICGGDARQAGLLRRQDSSLGERIATRASGFRESANHEVAVASHAAKNSPRGGNQEL
jgi:hypothetical protein